MKPYEIPEVMMSPNALAEVIGWMHSYCEVERGFGPAKGEGVAAFRQRINSNYNLLTALEAAHSKGSQS